MIRLPFFIKDIWNAYEVPYMNPGRHLYIELHKHLFPPDSEARTPSSSIRAAGQRKTASYISGRM